jgi:hypothetical protein
MVLQLLLKRQVVELAAQSELSVDFLLADREVLDVEEADMLGSIGQLLDEVLLALWSVKQAQVKSDKLGPVDCVIILTVVQCKALSHIVYVRSALVSGTCLYGERIAPGMVAVLGEQR